MPRSTNSLRTATALAASLSLLTPGLTGPAFAQQSTDDIVAACTAEFDGDSEAINNCVTERTGEEVQEQEQAEQEEQPSASVETEAEAEAGTEADAPAPEAEAPEAAAPEAAAAPEEAPVAEAPGETPAADAPEAPAEAVEAPAEMPAADAPEAPAEAAEAPAETPAADAPEAPAEAAEAPVEAPAAEAPEAAEAEAEAAPTAEAQAEPVPVEQAPATAADAPATEEPTADAPTAEAPAADAPAADAPIAEAPATETPATDAPVSEADAAVAPPADPPVAQTEAAIVETPTESAIAAEVAAQPEPELTADEQTARDQANNALQALASGEQSQAAAASADAESGDVEEQTVAEGETRTSDQDFATQAIVTERDDDGFDRNDKILLGALGALAVGTLLVNRSRVVSNSGDRVVVQREDGGLQVLKDDGVLLRQPGSNVRTERFDDGSSRQTVLREDGSSVVTIRDGSLRVIKREVVRPDGTRYLLIDDTETFQPVDVATLPTITPTVSSRSGNDELAAALAREQGLDRRFSLSQVRNISEVRALAPAFDVSSVTFALGSAAITPEQAGNLNGLAQEVLKRIESNPREVFLVEGHTDATGDAALNLALSDRRAESLALALNEYFGVPVENLVVQGYGESFLKVPTQAAEEANRRANVRQITGLLQTAAMN